MVEKLMQPMKLFFLWGGGGCWGGLVYFIGVTQHLKQGCGSTSLKCGTGSGSSFSLNADPDSTFHFNLHQSDSILSLHVSIVTALHVSILSL